MEDLLTQLTELKTGFWKAAGSDGKYYEDNLTDTGIMVLPFEDGILDKSQAVAAVKESSQWDSFSINNPHLLKLTKDQLVLLYQAIGKRKGQRDYRALISSLYEKEGNTWRLALHQQTPIP